MYCAQCGAKNSDEGRFCVNCGQPLNIDIQHNAPSNAPAFSVGAEDGANRIASLGSRFLALILDTVLCAALFASIGMWVASKYGGMTASGFSMEGTPALMAILLTSVVSFIYFWLMEGLWGGTLGKMIIGVQVVDKNGRICGLKRSLIRNILRLVDGLFLYLVGLVMAILSKQRQRLGDRIADTIVIEKNFDKKTRGVSLAVLFGIIVVSLILAVAMHKTPGSSLGAKSGMIHSESSGEIRIAGIEFLESKDGPIRKNAIYKPGEKLFLGYTITGYSINNQGMINLQIEIAAIDPSGHIMFQWRGNLNQRPEQGAPVSGWISYDIVPYAPPGAHTVRVKAIDLVRNTTAIGTAVFNIDAQPSVAATRLEVRDWLISASAGGPAMSQAEVAPGQTVYISAKLAGAQFRDSNINVRIAFQLIDPQGKVILDKPDFIVVNNSFAYRPAGFFLPFSANVQLPSGGEKGVYTPKFTIYDLNANTAVAYELKVRMK